MFSIKYECKRGTKNFVDSFLMKMSGFERIKYWWRRFQLSCMGPKSKVKEVEIKNPSQRVDIVDKKGNLKKRVKNPKARIIYVSPISKQISSVSRSESPATRSLRSVKKSSAKQGSPIPFSSEPDNLSGVLASPLSVNEIVQQSSDSRIDAKMT